jgi:hypothetical protein
VIIAERGDLTFVFNFHPYKSYSDYRIGTEKAGPFKVKPFFSTRDFAVCLQCVWLFVCLFVCLSCLP